MGALTCMWEHAESNPGHLAPNGACHNLGVCSAGQCGPTPALTSQCEASSFQVPNLKLGQGCAMWVPPLAWLSTCSAIQHADHPTQLAGSMTGNPKVWFWQESGRLAPVCALQGRCAIFGCDLVLYAHIGHTAPCHTLQCRLPEAHMTIHWRRSKIET